MKKIEVDIAEILLKCLELDLKDLEKSKEDSSVTFFYAQACQVTQIMHLCGLLTKDQYHILNNMIDELMDHIFERINYEYR